MNTALSITTALLATAAVSLTHSAGVAAEKSDLVLAIGGEPDEG